MDTEEEVTLADIKRYINFLIVRLDHIILDTPSVTINHLSSRGELFGFKLAYKIPRAAKGNSQLDREILATGDYSSLGNSEVNEIRFKHKKVFPIELDSDLIEKWESATLQISLSAVTSMPKAPGNRSSKHIARAFIPLEELLSPPFQISRDCTLLGVNFTGRLSISVEMGSRNTRIAELLSNMRRDILNTTFSLSETKPARRTRTRSRSRCRSHSCEVESREPSRETSIVSQPLHIPSRPSTSHSVNHVSDNSGIPTFSGSYQAKEPGHHRFMETNKPLASKDNMPIPLKLFDSGSTNTGALHLELTAHSATNLPLVQDIMGNWVPPMAFMKMLGRNETIMSIIAAPSCNPVWNWTGKFVVSSERGNFLIHILHKMGDKMAPLGYVTLSSPLHSFDSKEFEITLVCGALTTTSTIILSLTVQPYISSASSAISRVCRDIPSRSSNYTRNEENVWPIDDDDDTEIHNSYRRSRSTSSFNRLPPLDQEALRNKLQDDVEELLNVINNLGKR